MGAPATSAENTGRFIVLDGVEGAGKSTQVNLLAERLRRDGAEVVVVREPGGTATGEEIRAFLRSPARAADPLTPTTELFLFNAARAELAEKVIRPALARGATVITDRFTASTVAYQGYGRGLDVAFVRGICEAAAGELDPDAVVILDLDVESGRRRKGGEDDDAYIGAEAIAFHQRVRQGFLEQAKEHGWPVVDASVPVDAVAAAIRDAIKGAGSPE